jgi:ankyrin repeat protein
MYIAMFMGHTEIVKGLIDAGANVNATDWDNHTLLIQASESGDHAIMRLLIAAGADVNAKNSYGRTPLMYAADGCAETARILLEAGAYVEGLDLSK